MAREKRRKSFTGVYHVIIKGIDDRNIFMDDMDRYIFLQDIKKAREKGNFEILAYCLMNNHIHMLIKEGEAIGESIRRITVRYSHYYNKKYGRRGHLLNNRFRSEAVEEEAYLLNVFHYIHQNPVRARIVNNMEIYKWSSYNEYIRLLKNGKSWIDGFFMEKYFSGSEDFKSRSQERIDFINIHNRIYGRYDDEKIEKIQLIKYIKRKTGGSNRQLSRVLGVGKRLVDLAANDER